MRVLWRRINGQRGAKLMKDGHPFRETFTSLFRSRMIIHCGFFFFCLWLSYRSKKKREKNPEIWKTWRSQSPGNNRREESGNVTSIGIRISFVACVSATFWLGATTWRTISCSLLFDTPGSSRCDAQSASGLWKTLVRLLPCCLPVSAKDELKLFSIDGISERLVLIYGNSYNSRHLVPNTSWLLSLVCDLCSRKHLSHVILRAHPDVLELPEF